jgi:hypothetical protein
MTRVKTVLWGLIAAIGLPLVSTGCLVQPWVYDRMQDRYQHDKDHKTPILPPIRDGYPLPRCEDEPSDLEVLRVFNERRIRGVPYIYEEFQDDLYITKNLVVDSIDPPRFFPLVGMAQLHHCHWECGIYYNDLIQSSYPYPTYIRKPKMEVVLIDKDHLHLYAGPNPDQQRETLLEMTKWR